MIKIKRYTINDVKEWNEFVEKSKNGTFLFNRSYMDYHSDRFVDHSLMYYDAKGRLVAVMAGNEAGEDYWSHQGLTYGGLVLSMRARMADVMEMIEGTKNYLRERGFRIWHYKQMPTIYHKYPAEEDEYALWRSGAVLEVCNIASTIELDGVEEIPTERRRIRGNNRAEEKNYSIREDALLDEFWPIMEKNLRDRYNAKPVHSLEEMKLLQSRFDDKIKCYLVVDSSGCSVAGAVLFEMGMTVHVQYGHADVEGKENGALDMLYLRLLKKYSEVRGCKYFDFGTCNERGGQYLNENLIAQKEGFGGRGIAYKIYKIEL